jgi:hypothetical protein
MEMFMGSRTFMSRHAPYLTARDFLIIPFSTHTPSLLGRKWLSAGQTGTPSEWYGMPLPNRHPGGTPGLARSRAGLPAHLRCHSGG